MDNFNGTALKSVGLQVIKITSKSIQSNYKIVHCHIHSPPPNLGQKETNDDDDDDDNNNNDTEEEDLCLSIP